MKLSNKLLAAVMVCLLVVLAMIALVWENTAMSPKSGGQRLQITEICTKNETLLLDDQGRASDYLELYNPGKDLELTGYVFSDGKHTSQPLERTILRSGEYRVFFFGREHTGFSLSASGGDTVSLLSPEGNVVATVQTQPVEADQVMALQDGRYLLTWDASPGFANDEAGVNAFRTGTPDESPKLILSEVLLDNKSAIPDEKGVFSDAVELYNGSGEPIDLSGYYLSDTLENRFAWRLPQRTVQPGEYVVIFCDGENYIASDGTIHAPFGLNRRETLALTDARGAYQALALERSQENMSLALEEGRYVSMTPSLGFANTAEGAQASQQQRIDFASPLVIRELLVQDAGVGLYGRLQDAAEIVNRSGEAVSTAGWYLSDGGDPYAYALPEQVLQPGQCMVVPFSREDGAFGLSEGEMLYLTDTDGRCAPPVAWVAPEPGKSLHMAYSGSEISVSVGLISLGFDNDASGHTAWLQQTLPQGLRISEVMSANQSYLPDAYGKTYDYLELYNPTDEPIDLSGYALSDNPARPDKYPLGQATIAPGGYCVLILSDKPDISLPYQCVPMGLSSQGGAVYLSRGEEIIDSLIFPQLPGDMAYGRGREAAGFSLLAQATPGKANANAAELSQKPVALTAQGCYDDVSYVDVELFAPGPIYYTTDATTPDSGDRLYTGPIRITGTTVIRARCYEPGKQASQVLDLTYVVNEGDRLSVVTLVADPGGLWGWGNGIYTTYWADMEIPATVSLFEAEGGGFSQSCGLRMFGGYTRSFPKKSFACMFRDKYGASSLEYPLFGQEGLDEYHAFVLRTGGQDSVKGRIRDELITSLVAQYTQVPVQAYRPVTVYLNGEFWGVYFLREKVNENFVAGHYNVRPEEVKLQFGNGSDQEYLDLVRYARTHDLRVQEYYDYVASQMDIDEFIDYHAAQMWTGNGDMGNIKYFKVPGGKWTWILYDTDLALGVAGYNSVSEQLNPAGNGADDLFSTTLIVNLMKNPQFREKFLRRLAWQAQTIWNTPQLMERIAYLEDTIRPDMERDIARWNESLDFWNAKLRYIRYVVENRGRHVYAQVKSYFHLTDAQMQEYGFQKPE